MPRNRSGFTLVELLVACVVLGVIAGISVPRIRATIDAFAVEAAARDVADTFAYARLIAQRDGGADVRLDSISVTVRSGTRVLRARDVALRHGVRMRTNTALVRYAATGLTLGVGNGTITISRGASADTVVVSRLGRVRR